jgi:hypothetical protein
MGERAYLVEQSLIEAVVVTEKFVSTRHTSVT